MIYFLGDLITFFCRAVLLCIDITSSSESLLRQNPLGSTKPIFQKQKSVICALAVFRVSGKRPQVPLVHFVIEQKAKEILSSVMTSSLSTLFKKSQNMPRIGPKHNNRSEDSRLSSIWNEVFSQEFCIHITSPYMNNCSINELLKSCRTSRIK